MKSVSLTVKLQGPDPKDPKSIFNLAQGFYLAGRRCLLEIEVGPGVMQYLASPGVVNLCFSIELFVKTLIVLSGDTPKKTHNLGDLVANLSDSEQNEIRTLYEKSVQDPNLSDLLSEVSDYFQKVRYGFEYEIFALHEHAISVLAKVLYLYASSAHGVKTGLDKIRI